MRRRRRVFGRVTISCPITQKPVRIELTRQGVTVRTKYSRKTHALSLDDVISLARGQGVFRL